MTDLRERLHDTLDDQHTDLTLLSSRAQALGTRLRRRRRRNLATGSIALAAVLCVGVLSATQLLPGPQKSQPSPGFASEGGATVPASGRSVAAAAVAAVDQVADGTIDRIHGGVMSPITDGGPRADDELLYESVGALFAFTPHGASSPGEVSVSISHTTGAGTSSGMVRIETCPSFAVDCLSVTLPDGSVMDTYRSHSPDNSGDPAGFGNVYAQRTIGDVVVTVTAANGLHSPMLEGARLPNQPQPVLSMEQVKEIATQPWWGLELPAEYADADLPSFERFGSADTL